MGKRILLIVVVLILAALAYVGYSHYDAKRAETSGDVFSRDGSLVRLKADTVQTTDSSNNSQDKPSDQPQTTANSAVPAAQMTQAASDKPINPPQQPAAPGAPATDTINPNPPNGMVFSGTGHFQLYRQGNLTWRVNTETGQSCILFATDEEWKKARVYRNGCGNR